jgi:prolyl-tRNA synthetase
MTSGSSRITFSADRDHDFSEWYNVIIRQAELVDDRFNIKGMVVYRPYGMKIVRAIYRFFEDRLEKRGHQPTQFPVLIPEENLDKEAEHVKGFKPETFWVTMGGDEQLTNRYALRPTSETAFYYMYSQWIRSPSDLPLKLYQSVSVYRHETKATKPLIRGREFFWIEAHDAFATKEEAMRQVEEDENMMQEVIEGELAIPVLFLRRPQWDKFKGAVNTYAADVVMPDGVTLQVASTHYLGMNFSEAFDIGYFDAEGKKNKVEQTCFGPGVSRILAAVISIHGDNLGLVLPFKVAPTHAAVIPIPGEGVHEYSIKVVQKLKDMGLTVEFDDSDETPGAKFYKWEFLGIPLRIEVGGKEVSSSTVTIFDRATRKRKSVGLDELEGFIRGFSLMQHQELHERAESLVSKFLDDAETLEKARSAISSGRRILRSYLCSLELDGEECAGKIETELGLSVRGEELNAPLPKEKKCLVCGKDAKHQVYLAEAY